MHTDVRRRLTGVALCIAFAIVVAAPAFSQEIRRDAAAAAALVSIDARDGALSSEPVSFERVYGDTAPSGPASAVAIFSETFSSGVPPAGWAQFNNGIGLVQAWINEPLDGNPLPSARNIFENITGTVNCATTPELCAQDWLVTPQIAIPATGYRVRLDQRQSFTTNFGSRFAVLVSATSQTDPAQFTQVAAWTEVLGPNGEVIPTTAGAVGPTSWLRFGIDLSAYAGQSVYIAFRHTNDDGDDFRLDNVNVETIPVALPECAINFVPPDGTTGLPYGTNPISMTWAEATTGDPANGFLLDVGTDAGATNIANGVQWGLQRAVNLINTAPNTTYFWRIRPYNAVGTNAACPINSFTTQGATSSFPFTASFGSPTCLLPTNWSNLPPVANGELWGFATTRTNGAVSDHTTGSGCFAYVDDGTPHTTPTSLVMPLFDSNGLTTLRLSFWLQNRRTGTTPISQLFVDVSTDGGATYTLGVGSFTTLLTAWTQQTVNLDAYVNQPNLRIRFRAIENATAGLSDISLDDIRLAEAPTTPIFSVAPNSDPVQMGSAGACALIPSTVQSLTITNVGVGVLNVTSASIGGGSSAAYSVNTTNLPAALGENQSVVITLTFAPPSGMSGVQTGTLQIDYNDGTPQVAVLNLSGTAVATSVAVGSGGGYLFRNSNGEAACTAGSPLPMPATALVPFLSHTKVLTAQWTGGEDDGWFEINAAALDGLIEGGSYRFFGQTFEALRITTNGNVFFNMTTYSAASDRNLVLPNSANGGAVIAGAAMDLEFTTADYASDNAGIGGTPGVWYGATDVDGDGDQELVLTYYHAYDFGAVSLPATTGAFLTFQIILGDGGEPNAEDYAEVRFFDGLDANGVPFRQNTAGATVENDVAIGLSNIGGTAGMEYRDNSATVGGPLYAAGGGSLSVRFQAETQATAGGLAGWRMMGAPVLAYDVARLANLNLVQGVTGQYPTHGVNVYTDWDGSLWTPATAVADVLTPGQGFLWYLYNIDLDPPDTDGTSNSYALPMALQGTGAEVSLASNYTITLHAGGDGWDLISNPYRASLDVSGLATWAQGGTLASGVGQVWNPTGSYVLTSTMGNVVTAWQGVMIQNNTAGGATSLSVPAAARTTGGTFVGLTEEERLIAFELRGTRADNGEMTIDKAAVMYFHPEATAQGDLFDAGKLYPLTDRFATIAFIADRDGETVLRAQESRPTEIAALEVPLGVSAVGTTETLVLTWPTLENVPQDWTVELRDLVTGAEIDLRLEQSYTFTVEPTLLRTSVPSGTAPILGSASMTTLDARFVLSVTSATTGTGGDMPTVYALHAPAPNPVSGPSAVVRFDLPEASDAIVEVFDMLGRRVATLAEGAREAGRHAARLDAGALSSGVYVVRMRAGDFVQAQRVTVSR